MKKDLLKRTISAVQRVVNLELGDKVSRELRDVLSDNLRDLKVEKDVCDGGKCEAAPVVPAEDGSAEVPEPVVPAPHDPDAGVDEPKKRLGRPKKK